MKCFRIAAVSLIALLAGCATGIQPLQFQTPADATAVAPHFYWQGPNDPYLTELRERYGLKQVVKGTRTDFERVVAVTHWAHQRWEHSATHVAAKDDPISILDAAAHGERFRCVEYASVVAGSLTSLGIPTRMVFVETDSRVRQLVGISGHVFAEAFLRDEKRWIMLDAQWDAVPVVGGRPLDAVDFQHAIASSPKDIQVASLSSTSAKEYVDWIGPYLKSFTIRFDERFSAAPRQPGFLGLVPVGATEDDSRVTYTHSPAVFYQAPETVGAAQ